MLEEDDRPQRGPVKPRDLSRLSVEELRAYIGRLEAEIARAREAIDKQQAVRSAAEALFKRPSGN